MAEGKVTIKVDVDAADAEKKIDAVGDSAKKAGDDAKAAGSGAFSKVEKGAAKAEGDADSLGDAAKQAGKDASSAGSGSFDEVEQGARDAEGAIGKLKGVVGGIAGAFAVGELVGGLQELSAATNEYNEDMGKLTTSAQVNGASIDSAKGSYKSMVGILGETDQAVEATNHLLTLCGDNQQQLSQWTDISAGVYAMFGDSLPIEGLTEAANETARVGQVTGPMADALNWARKSTDEWSASLANHPKAQEAFNSAVEQGASVEDAFNAALAATSDEGERAQIVTEALSGAYGEAGEVYQETNADVIAYRESQDELKEKTAELGEKVMPLVTDVTNAFADALGWCIEHSSELAPLLVTLGGAMLGLLIMATVNSLMNAAAGATALFNGSVAILNGTLLANPITWVVMLLGGLVAALVYAYNTNEDFRNKVNEAWEFILDFLGGAVDTVVKFFTEDVPKAIDDMIKWFQELPGKIQKHFSDAVNKARAWASDMAEKARKAGSDFIQGVVEFFTGLPGRVWGLLSDALARAGEFAASLPRKAADAARGFADELLGKLAALPGQLVSSGAAMIRGLADGLAQGFRNAMGVVQDGLATIRSFFPFSPAKRGPFSGHGYTTFSGRAMVRDLARGIAAAKEYAVSAARGLMADVSAEFGVSPDIEVGSRLSAAASYSVPSDSGGIMGRLDALYARIDELDNGLGKTISDSVPQPMSARDMGRAVRGYA